jgi:hypothetical protein
MSEPKARPIIMRGESVRAVQAGRKVQTRRIVKTQPQDHHWQYAPALRDRYRHRVQLMATSDGPRWRFSHSLDGREDEFSTEWKRCPYGAPGDYLYVKEAVTRSGGLVQYRADGKTSLHLWPAHWKRDPQQARFMLRRFARLWLEVEDVRCERLQDISEEDAKAEGLIAQEGDGGAPGAGYKWTGTGYHGAGFDRHGAPTFHTPASDGRCGCNVAGPSPAACAFRELWNSINGKRAPWSSNPWTWVVSFRPVERPEWAGGEGNA